MAAKKLKEQHKFFKKPVEVPFLDKTYPCMPKKAPHTYVQLYTGTLEQSGIRYMRCKNKFKVIVIYIAALSHV